MQTFWLCDVITNEDRGTSDSGINCM